MMTLEDNIWKELEGGYRGTEYDASVPLKKLEEAATREQIDKIFEELWDELHHQGDVGLASYLALPHLVRIARAKGLFDWNVLGICAVIEQQRHLGNNPSLPNEFQEYYNDGLAKLRDFVIANMNKEVDDDTFRMACSALATASGRIKLGKAIMELDEDVLDEFLEQI
ncbi:MAG: hypothetical protein ACOYXT_04370 [Bacteroidota bacterium]